MKILEIIPNLNIGGAEAFVVNISNAFVSNGHECKVITLYELGDNDVLAQKLDAKIVKESLGKSGGFDKKCLFKVLRQIKKSKPDVVHAHVGAITYLLFAALFFRRCKYYATIHSEASREAGGLIRRIIRKGLFKLKLVIPVTISPESMLSFKDFYGFEPAIIYNGVSESTSNVFENYKKKVFIHPASCQPVKNQRLLFQAFMKITEKYSDVELHWFGSHSHYESLFNELSVFFGDKIIYKGVTQDIRKYMKHATAMCLSSNMEGMPMTIIEAMSVGCIAIATPVGGCINMIDDGINGFLSSDMSVDAYAESLEMAIQLSDEELLLMRVAARNEYEQKYTINKTAHEYITLFSQS